MVKLFVNRVTQRVGWNLFFSLVIVIISILLVYITKQKHNAFKGDRVQSLLFLFKLIAMLWLVFVPVKDYFNWSRKQEISGKLNLTFFGMFFLIFLISIVVVASVCDKFSYTYIIMNNYVFFPVFAMLPLSVLWLADKQIRDYIKIQQEKSPNRILAHEHALVCTNLVNDDRIILENELTEFKRFLGKADSAWKFYDASIRYADFCVLVSVVVSYILFLSLPFLLSRFSSTPFSLEEWKKIEIFFDGVLILQLIISTVIYFCIAYTHENEI